MIKQISSTLFFGLMLAVSAQATEKVNIAFPFRTPSGELPGGRYTIETKDTSGSKYLQLTNVETKASVLLYPESRLDNHRPAGSARVVFSCGASRCDLAQIWTDSVTGFAVRHPRPAVAEAEPAAAGPAGTPSTE